MRVWLGLLLATAVACEGAEPIVQYEPHGGGPVYPNRRPKLPAAAGFLGFVSDNGSDTVTLLDLPAAKTLASIPVGRDPLSLDGPHHLAVDASGNVYVALAYPAPPISPGPHSAHSSSKRSGYVLKLAADDFAVIGEVQVDPNPGDVVLTPDGSRVLVTHFDLQRAADPKLSAQDRRATLAVIETEKMGAGGATATKMPVCIAPHGLAVALDGKRAYVACYGDDAIGIVDLDDLKKPVETVTLSGAPASPGAPSWGPYSAVLSPDGATVALGGTDGKATALFDTATKTFRASTVATQGAPFFPAWSPDGTKLYVPTQAPDMLVMADVATGALRTQRIFDAATCQKPHEAIFSPDGSQLYLVCEGDHVTSSVVLSLDPEDLTTRAVMPVGVYPDRLTFRSGR